MKGWEVRNIWVPYFGLLSCALVYVKSSIDEYMSGRTSYSDKTEAISLYDIPTITFQLVTPFNLRYGDHFIIKIMQDVGYIETIPIPNDQSTRVSDAVASFLQEFCLRKKFLQDARNLARILHLNFFI